MANHSTSCKSGETVCSFLAIVLAVGCGGGNIELGAGGTRGGAGGQGGGQGGSGGGVTVVIPEVPDAGPDLPGGGHCGDKALERNETCDDGNTAGGDGCSPACQIEANHECPTVGELCINKAECGNKILTSNETCDDGNTEGNDGCSADCQDVEVGWVCPVPGKSCIPECGDGKLTGSEPCDDGNTKDRDGCSGTCQAEAGFDCPAPGQSCIQSVCGNGKIEGGEKCDCGSDPKNLPNGCKAVNGLFYGDGKGCSKTCTAEPSCLDNSGKTQACTSSCGDGNIDPDEKCDDGNRNDGDGCSSDCHEERGFVCDTTTQQDSTTCQNGSGQCLELPVIYRDFQPENVSGGHPDFYWLGAKDSGGTITTWCVPNSGGPSKGNDSTERCWGILADALQNGKPQPGSTTSCKCKFSDWSVGNTSHIPGGYDKSDSPLYAPGGYRAGVNDYTQNGGPVWSGTSPAYKSAASLKQWFTDDKSVNTAFTGVLELAAIGSNMYQYASKSHLVDGGFFPLDTLNASQKTLCYMWPYWNSKFFPGCSGDQYLFAPRIEAGDCGANNPIDQGCWVSGLKSTTHDNYFTDEVRYYFAYDGDNGMSLQFFGDDDLYIFINGKLVLDLGGVHQQLPGRVEVQGSPGKASITEGGCLDSANNIVGATAGSTACSPANTTPIPAAATADFRTRNVDLGLQNGKVYEIAIFGGDRHPPESNYQLTLQGFATKKSSCKPRCGDGVATAGEQCDCGDGTVDVPDGCPGSNNDTTYGGCKVNCTYGPYCGDGATQTDNGGDEECDHGKDNGSNTGKDGCTFGCKKPHYCGDGFIDADREEECDQGEDKNGKTFDRSGNPADPPEGYVHCKPDCTIPTGIPL